MIRTNLLFFPVLGQILLNLNSL